MPVELDQIETMVNLDVPYYSQKEEQALQKYGRKACGLTSLRMVLAYYGHTLDIHQMDLLATQVGAYQEDKGWIHAGLVNMARDLGLKGYRINYSMLGGDDLKKFRPILAAEGASLAEIQHFETNLMIAKNQGPDQAIQKLLRNNNPVITSMETTYANTIATHMVVIKGYKEDDYIINDPWDFGTNHHIPVDNFNQHWTGRAVVIFP